MTDVITTNTTNTTNTTITAPPEVISLIFAFHDAHKTYNHEQCAIISLPFREKREILGLHKYASIFDDDLRLEQIREDVLYKKNINLKYDSDYDSSDDYRVEYEISKIKKAVKLLPPDIQKEIITETLKQKTNQEEKKQEDTEETSEAHKTKKPQVGDGDGNGDGYGDDDDDNYHVRTSKYYFDDDDDDDDDNVNYDDNADEVKWINFNAYCQHVFKSGKKKGTLCRKHVELTQSQYERRDVEKKYWRCCQHHLNEEDQQAYDELGRKRLLEKKLALSLVRENVIQKVEQLIANDIKEKFKLYQKEQKFNDDKRVTYIKQRYEKQRNEHQLQLNTASMNLNEQKQKLLNIKNISPDFLENIFEFEQKGLDNEIKKQTELMNREQEKAEKEYNDCQAKKMEYQQLPQTEKIALLEKHKAEKEEQSRVRMEKYNQDNLKEQQLIAEMAD
jgi:hypothetical protein